MVVYNLPTNLRALFGGDQVERWKAQFLKKSKEHIDEGKRRPKFLTQCND